MGSAAESALTLAAKIPLGDVSGRIDRLIVAARKSSAAPATLWVLKPND